ncbi:MAG: ankyrin repeat domain-containing protein, partial [Hyphomonadaceae bacterium]|nr:ankyrin repeat domain-containing protein [Hyphomonadaceae bacterium]
MKPAIMPMAIGISIGDILILIVILVIGSAFVRRFRRRRRFQLHRAMYGNAGEVEVTALIDAGADIEAQDKDGRTPLYQAAFLGKAETVAALIKAGADVNARTKYSQTPLHKAHGAGMVAALIEAGADVEARDKWGKTPLRVVA